MAERYRQEMVSEMNCLAYPLVCFDLDGTLVDDTIYIWKTLHETFGTDVAARKEAHRDYFSGRISYKEWFDHDLRLLRAAGATRARIQGILNALTPMNGARELLATLKERGHKLAVISGSLDIVVNQLFDASLFDYILVNRLYFDASGHIAGGDHTPYDLDGKADGLRELADKEGLRLSQTVFIGDHENDVWVAKAAGLSIAFNCKSDALRSVCDTEVTEKDLRLLARIIT
jgi:phosphoserine phosphatase